MVKLLKDNLDICIVCNDFEESLRFYRDIMGFEVYMDVNIDAETATQLDLAPKEFRQVRMKAGETSIKLMQIDPPPPPRSDAFAAGVRWITYYVSDLQGTYKKMKEQGVRFLSEPVEAKGWGDVVCAVDPDGILVEMYEPKEA